MKAATDAIVIQIESEFPGWQVWVVNRVVGGPVWCARPHDDHAHVINVYSADDLREHIRRANDREPEPEPFGYLPASLPPFRIPADGPGVHRIPRDPS